VVARLSQRLKATLAHLALQGPRDFYEGDLARAMAADVEGGGGALSVRDLAAFRAQLREPLANALEREMNRLSADVMARDIRTYASVRAGKVGARPLP